ncbi:exodeoxyribonuclease I [Simiduia aestuariiviva]|uniref:Exodeoxyribonuclease I n=1 Tax=Simiduia aestuariiviva TaxID=1510459 RepID=A0A839UMF1_9GAMM|nr:exodeoxyribonuclease I [Simiduia aestuariiviva]MBB3169364.1 exodeoxyribonuclease-1 [Simiduia aestuariiviva]
MNSLYWHDYETWGANPAQDRPAQFAGIRTDEALNIIGEPLMIYAKPTEDLLPHPEACLITGITPQRAQAEGVSEPEFIARIHQEFIQPGTCGVGYNSLRFDDEVTRYTLFRNFFDPYEREWKNGNSRWDIIDVVRMTFALRPEGIQWPTHPDGAPSFKLEDLAAANGLQHESAHDALSDVYATIALAKRIRECQPRLYDYAYSLRLKQTVQAQFDWIHKKPLLHTSSRFPAAQGCTALIMPLAPHPVNKNAVIVYNLAVDPAPLLELSAEDIAARVFVSEADLPDGAARIPLKLVHANKSPMLAPLSMLTEPVAARLNIDRALCEKHWQLLKDADLNAKLREVFAQREFPPTSDPEQQLYNGFIPNEDRALMARVRESAPEQLVNIQFKDARLNSILQRYRARHFPNTLTEEEALWWQEYCYERITNPEAGASIVLDDFIEALALLRERPEACERDQHILDALEAYGAELV